MQNKQIYGMIESKKQKVQEGEREFNVNEEKMPERK